MILREGKKSGRTRFVITALACSSTMLAGCFELDDMVTAADESPGVPPIAANAAPSIAGAPAGSVSMGERYSFVPTATDPDADQLSFSIQNKPDWVSFDAANGSLTGDAQLGDIGMYSGIAISVSDGELIAELPAFSVQVVQVGDRSVTLTWMPPTENSDGTALMDLTSYKIYYGLAAGDYPNEILVDNPGITTYVVDGLTPNTYFFVATAINGQGLESVFSNSATKIVL